MYCNRFSFVTGILLPLGIRSTDFVMPKSAQLNMKSEWILSHLNSLPSSRTEKYNSRSSGSPSKFFRKRRPLYSCGSRDAKSSK